MWFHFGGAWLLTILLCVIEVIGKFSAASVFTLSEKKMSVNFEIMDSKSYTDEPKDCDHLQMKMVISRQQWMSGSGMYWTVSDRRILAVSMLGVRETSIL